MIDVDCPTVSDPVRAHVTVVAPLHVQAPADGTVWSAGAGFTSVSPAGRVSLMPCAVDVDGPLFVTAIV